MIEWIQAHYFDIGFVLSTIYMIMIFVKEEIEGFTSILITYLLNFILWPFALIYLASSLISFLMKKVNG